MDIFLTWTHAYPVLSLQYTDMALNLLLQYWFNLVPVIHIEGY